MQRDSVRIEDGTEYGEIRFTGKSAATSGSLKTGIVEREPLVGYRWKSEGARNEYRPGSAGCEAMSVTGDET